MEYRVLAIITFLVSTLSATAQVKIASGGETIQLDTLTKVIGVLLTLGGFFMGYMQMKMANKMAEQDKKFSTDMRIMEDKLSKDMRMLEDKLQSEIKISAKDLELSMKSMATHHDIKNLQTVMALQHEITIDKTKSLEKQLDLAAELLKRSKEGK